MRQAFLINCNVFQNAAIVRTLNAWENFDWLQVWPGMIVVIGEATLASVSDALHQANPKATYLVSQIKLRATTMGWMPPKVWDFIRQGTQQT